MELLNTHEMSEADKFAISSGIAAEFLMNRAGQHVADTVEAEAQGPCHLYIIAGPGNNGGDALIAAKFLKSRGYTISLDLLGDPTRLKGSAAWAAGEWISAGGKIHEGARLEPPENTGMIIDGMFGAGLDRPVEGPYADCINAINNTGKPVIAIDMPSGINGDSGLVMGTAIKATSTATFFRLKPGHLLYPGRALCGKLKLYDIGIPQRALGHINPTLWQNHPKLWRQHIQKPPENHHKYNRGAVLVAKPPAAMPGASQLAAAAALRSGAGLVTVLEGHQHPVGANLYAAIMQAPPPQDANWQAFLARKKITASLIGPGAAPDEKTRDMVLAFLQTGQPLCLDAGAITAFEKEPDVLIKALDLREQGNVILTPHEGEFKRLFGPLSEAGKCSAAIKAAASTKAVIVLKGADTVIAAPDGRAVINHNAPETLATAGSGDVLTGIITGFLASGMPAWPAACAAVYLHAEAANLINKELIADDLLDAVTDAKKAILKRP